VFTIGKNNIGNTIKKEVIPSYLKKQQEFDTIRKSYRRYDLKAQR